MILKNGHFDRCNRINCSCEANVYLICLSVAIFMVLLEIIGGYLVNSLSLVGDGLHLFVDSIALLVGLFVIHKSKKNNKNSTLWDKRGGLINGSLLALICIFLVIFVFYRMKEDFVISGIPMIVVASIGLFGNIFQHQLLLSVKRGHNLTKKGIIGHVMTDALQSIAVIIGAVIITFTNETFGKFTDLILSLLIALYMFVYALNLIHESITGKKLFNLSHDHTHHH